MFYILIVIGLVFIVAGNILERLYSKSSEDLLIDEEDKQKMMNAEDAIESKKEMGDLEVRIKGLEEMLFNKILEEEISSSETEGNKKEMKIKEDSIEKYKLIVEYEKQNKSIDEIAKLLETNKGEVLLLKSLYKNL